ncbi:MAG: hypothetical protein HY831_03415 [Candidatus Aenigmarchaeota archaeon]|nr:hypothetical protein [Candidatus Aenigmarchaeota archaeon]
MTKQINLKLPENLYKAARSYAETHGFRNVQELASESIREKVFEENIFDETFTDSEIMLIDKLIESSIDRKKLKDEKELMKVLG